MIKVAIFDDHHERRNALCMLIDVRPDMTCTGAYENCALLVEDLRDNVPDVVLMDIDMPVVNGIEGVKLLHHYYPNTLIIMQTVFDDDGKIFSSILAGANGYVLKTSPPDKLITAIHEVMDGGAPMTASIAKRTLELFRNKPPAVAQDIVYNLTLRETEVLTLLVKGYSHKMAASELGISIFTINNHVKSIYRKLEAHNAPEVVAIALKHGIIS